MAGDPPKITINRNEQYHAFEADTSISASTATESIDIKATAELNISASLTLSAQIAGVKIDARLLAVSIEGDFGKKFEFLNGPNMWFSTAKGSAFLAQADAKLAEARQTLNEMHLTSLKMGNGVVSSKKSGAAVRNRAMSLDM